MCAFELLSTSIQIPMLVLESLKNTMFVMTMNYWYIILYYRARSKTSNNLSKRQKNNYKLCIWTTAQQTLFKPVWWLASQINLFQAVI